MLILILQNMAKNSKILKKCPQKRSWVRWDIKNSQIGTFWTKFIVKNILSLLVIYSLPCSKTLILHFRARKPQNLLFFAIGPQKKGVKRVTKSDKNFGKSNGSQRLVLNGLTPLHVFQIKNAEHFFAIALFFAI